jgi:hypothetical protein
VRDGPALFSHAKATHPAKLLAVAFEPHAKALHPPPGHLGAMGSWGRGRSKLVSKEIEWELGYFAGGGILIQVERLPWRGLGR